MTMLYGSICLSDIPKELIKEVTLQDGTKKMYLNVAVVERREKSQFGHTHFITCSPKQEERKEGVNYFIGDLKTHVPQNVAPTTEQINNAPAAREFTDLPF
jgi:hypothetical protein